MGDVKNIPDRVKTRRGLVRYPNFLKIIDFRLNPPEPCCLQVKAINERINEPDDIVGSHIVIH